MTDLNCTTSVKSDKMILLRYCKNNKSDKIEIWHWKDDSLVFIDLFK